ncbi:MAG: hypothetical protein TU35_005275 [Thermoproteus sp. AZ2]|jgi:hypothetical protein|uniref:Uncharacterized protein n=1 Tax=Thermoproteus sp. AZ2 TaxID=1609232 RepID=A0ACC6V0R2_9CREN|nr:MAG: hypothetical protein TU35_07250 [Thermoproteus sp. AZ2]
MSFYDFLWESVRRPELLAQYAEGLGIRLELNGGDFYQRLRAVARAAAEVMRRELAALEGPVPQMEERCADLRRFLMEAAMDLKLAGLSAEGLEPPC